MAHIEVSETDETPSVASTWEDRDVSGYSEYTSAVTGVIVRFVNENNVDTYECGIRKNGSTDARTAIGLGSGFYDNESIRQIGVDGSGIFEAYSENLTNLKIYVIGFRTDDCVFHTNAIDKSLGSTSTWTDITAHASAIAAIFEVIPAAGWSDRNYGFRKNGSTDVRTVGRATYMAGVEIGCDGSGICEHYITNTDVDIFLVGYVTKEATYNTNAIDKSLSATSTWTDIVASSADAIAVVIEPEQTGGATTGSRTGLRKNGSSVDHRHQAPGYKSWHIEAVDGSQLWEGWIDGTGMDFYETGYLEAAAAVGGRIMSSMADHGGLVGRGGIAGQGGGLAG